MKINNIKFWYILFLLFSPFYLFSQEQVELWKDYTWEANPKPYVPDADTKDLEEVRLQYHVYKDLMIPTKKSNLFYEQVITHEKIYVNSEKALERWNKIILHISNNEEIIEDKVRVIKKNGEIIELNNKDINEAVDEETGVKYKYYTVKGLEKGSVIERLTTSREEPNVYGYPVSLQISIPSRDIQLKLAHPRFLLYDIKNVNFQNQASKDTVEIQEKLVHTIQIKQNDALLEEPMSNMERARQKVYYKLTGNYSTGVYNMNSYDDFALRVKERINPDADKKEQAAIKKLLSTQKLSTDKEKKIRQIEDIVKSHIRLVPYLDAPERSDIAITNKLASSITMARVFAQIFKMENIENEILFTTDRFDRPFLKDFQSYSFLDEIGFFFPDLKTYLGVNEVSRYPTLPYGWTYNNALYLTKKNLGGNLISASEVKSIPPLPAEFSVDTMRIEVDFRQDINNPKIKTYISFNGYAAGYFQPAFDYIEKDRLDEIRKQIAQTYTYEEVVEDNIKVTTQNEGFSNLYVKPFIVNLEYDGNVFVENAGNKIIFQVGKIIGPQSELYQEKKRKLPIENEFNRGYERKITIFLPEGYTIGNIQDIVFNLSAGDKGKQTAYFVSKYDKNNDTYTISNQEYYHQIEYPLSDYDAFAAVINAAADFNKVKFIIENK